jgi:hypothetical protein
MCSYAQAFSENKNVIKISLVLERYILYKHEIENRSKKSFEMFILYHLNFNLSSILTEIGHFVSHVFFCVISLPSLEKK